MGGYILSYDPPVNIDISRVTREPGPYVWLCDTESLTLGIWIPSEGRVVESGKLLYYVRLWNNRVIRCIV